MVNVGILVSGNGTNMEAIIKASENGILKDRINPVVVISNRVEAKALERCKQFKVPFATISHQREYLMCELLQHYEVELVVLAGYDRLLKLHSDSNCILRTFKDRIINIHPSLLPSFPGMNAVKRALDYGSKITGCTVHWVDRGMDTGKIIGQKHCEVSNDDSLETVTERIHEIEHDLYPEALRSLYLLKEI